MGGCGRSVCGTIEALTRALAAFELAPIFVLTQYTPGVRFGQTSGRTWVQQSGSTCLKAWARVCQLAESEKLYDIAQAYLFLDAKRDSAQEQEQWLSMVAQSWSRVGPLLAGQRKD